MYSENGAHHYHREHSHQISTMPDRRTIDGLTTEQSNIFRLVNFVTICALIGLFGIVTNVMNMMVFFKQGFNSTSNISFFALALSDLLCLITVEWYDICLNPYLETDTIPFIPKEVQYLTGAWLHVCFGRITGWITVYITAERCLGVALPLKVKQIVTLRRTSTIMFLIFIINIMMLLPEYSIAYLDWKFVPERNKSFVGLVYRSYKNEAYGLVYILTSTSGMLSFVAVIILTIFLVAKLGQNSSGRFKEVLGNNSEARSMRDKKTVKMVVMIASILIVCYIPSTAASLVTVVEPEFMIGAKYANTFFAVWSVAYVCNTINSSVNTILYYNMSTNYRQTFIDLFGTMKKPKSEQISSLREGRKSRIVELH